MRSGHLVVVVFALTAACHDRGGPAAGSPDAPPRPVDAADEAAPDAAEPALRDVTFFVVADTHADPPESYDLRAIARVIDAVADEGEWPSVIGGQVTGFVGGPIGEPSGVVFVGDITGWGTAPLEIPTFRRYFQAGYGPESIAFPGYVGLGNHDVDDADRPPDLAAAYRNAFWAFVDERHAGAAAPAPVTAFDDASHMYSWDVDDVHFVQAHRFAGDTGHGLPSSLPFLAGDLEERAGDGRPVFLFHHYGMDPFGTQPRWWTEEERAAYRDTLAGSEVAGIFVGHSHAAFHYEWEGLRIFHVNNAKAENGTGNNDGNGSFAIVRVTEDRLEVVTCRWLDDQGNFELVAPFYSGGI